MNFYNYAIQRFELFNGEITLHFQMKHVYLLI